MKKTMFLLACLTAVSAFGVQIYEPFRYVAGSLLAGQGGWVLAAGTSPKIGTNGLATPGLAPTSEGNSAVFGNSQMEVRRTMKNEFGPGEYPGYYWYSLAFNLTDLGTLTTNGDFIAAFGSTNTTAGYGGMLYLRKDPGGSPGGYNIGISRASTVGADIAWSATVSHVGDTNFVVCRYATPDQSSTDTLLWINPDPTTYGAANPPPADLTANSGLHLLATVGQFVLHQAAATGGPGSVTVDTVRVEGNWASVTPVPLTIAISLLNSTDVSMTWGGYQNVFIQQATNLTPPVVWRNLNSYPASAAINSWTVPGANTNSTPGFYRLIAWYAE
jgi:hypothetical protein